MSYKLNEKNKTSVVSAECIVVEDSHWGLEAAKAAGMHSVAVTNSYDAEQLKLAEKVVTNLNQLSISDLEKLCSQEKD